MKTNYLSNIIKNQIKQAGPISFARFMDLALYHPENGYYTCKQQILGKHGDFTTAPEIGNLFAKCLANKIKQLVEDLNLTSINLAEFGAGSGKLAIDLIISLQELDLAVDTYQIIEISPNLKRLQQENISANPAAKNTKIYWHDELSDDFSGIVIANEVLDAMPVTSFAICKDQLFERCVSVVDNNFVWFNQTPHEILIDNIKKIDLENIWFNYHDYKKAINLDKTNVLSEEISSAWCEYSSEINLNLDQFFAKLSKKLVKGAAIFVDYGFLDYEYYHPTRNTGTIMCHYQHKSHPDPFINIGTQDITAHVDFTAVARIAEDNNFVVEDYSTLAKFLIGNGIVDLVNFNNNPAEIAIKQEINLLTSPAEMGELFKVISLEKS